MKTNLEVTRCYNETKLSFELLEQAREENSVQNSILAVRRLKAYACGLEMELIKELRKKGAKDEK